MDFLRFIVTGFNLFLALFNIISYIKLQKMQDYIDNCKDCSGNSTESSPKNTAFIPLLILGAVDLVVFALLCIVEMIRI